MKTRFPPQSRIVTIYVIAGSLWIYFSDMLIGAIFGDAQSITIAQHFKGWFFIAVTGLLLFSLIKRDFDSLIRFLRPSLAIPYCHHEKWNGEGYPRGIRREAIPLAARLFAIIDVWDALCHPRVYKDAWPEDRVLNYIREQAEKHFDPALVKLFIDNYDRIIEKGQMS